MDNFSLVQLSIRIILIHIGVDGLFVRRSSSSPTGNCSRRDGYLKQSQFYLLVLCTYIRRHRSEWVSASAVCLHNQYLSHIYIISHLCNMYLVSSSFRIVFPIVCGRYSIWCACFSFLFDFRRLRDTYPVVEWAIELCADAISRTTFT